MIENYKEAFEKTRSAGVIAAGALDEVFKKGEGAYYSSGSRPNQTPESWGKARVASVLVGGASRNIDKKIVEKYNIPKI